MPLVSLEGDAYECGRTYAGIVLQRWPGYRKYLDLAWHWEDGLFPEGRRLLEQHAAHIIELHRGIRDVAGPPTGEPEPDDVAGGCTSFGVSGAATLDGCPLAGQTKDTPYKNSFLYTVLRIRFDSAPTLLVVAYPGEVLGIGLWSRGSSIWRNSLFSTGGGEQGFTMQQWGTLALAMNSVDDAAEVAKQYGIRDCGNCLITDSGGRALSVEFNVGGVSVVPAAGGIATHANHPVGEETAPFEDYPHEEDGQRSRDRMQDLRALLEAERDRLTPQVAMQCLSDHRNYPRSICRHVMRDLEGWGTSAAVVAEPTRGTLHVVRGNPCCNWARSYAV